MGKTGETQIAQFAINSGFNVLPVYENSEAYKGPTVYTAEKRIVSPDMIVFNKKETMWIEAKHKSAFTWHKITGRWTTGIDLRHFYDYCELIEKVSFPVWLLFLHRDGIAKDTPEGKHSPAGLFGGKLENLMSNINHKSDKHANGMVYWNYLPDDEENSQLKKIADYKDGIIYRN